MLIGGNQGFGIDLGILEHAGRVPGVGIDDELMVTIIMVMVIISIKVIIVMVIISIIYS